MNLNPETKIISIWKIRKETTLADMFINLYGSEKITGQIYLDNTNLFDLNPIYLRKQIGYVHNYLFI